MEKENGEIKEEKQEIDKKKIQTKMKNKKEEIEKKPEKEKSLVEVEEQEETISIEPEKLEEIGKVIQKQKTVPQMHQKKMMQRVFENLILAIIFLLYFFFINLGAMHIGEETFLVDLQVFSLFTLAISIYLFETAYKKDKGRIAIHGIEVLVMAIITLLSLYLFQMQKDMFPILLNTASLVFAVYFVGKSIYLYIRMKKRALKQNNDVHRIAKTKD